MRTDDRRRPVEKDHTKHHRMHMAFGFATIGLKRQCVTIVRCRNETGGAEFRPQGLR